MPRAPLQFTTFKARSIHMARAFLCPVIGAPSLLKDPHSMKTQPTSAPTPKVRRAPLPDAIAFRVDEVPLMGGPARTKLYELAAAGKLKLVRVHGRTLVDGDSLRALLRNGT